MLRFLHCFAAAWLVLALPLGQHEALLHALGHAMHEGAAQEQAPAPEKCPDHSLYTAFAGALGSAPHCIAALDGGGALEAHRDSPDAALAPRSPYRSRAPPATPQPR